MLGAGGRASALARGGGEMAFAPICKASPSASSARVLRGTTVIARCDIVSEVFAVKVEQCCRTDQHEIDGGLADDGAERAHARSRTQQPNRLRHPVEPRQE